MEGNTLRKPQFMKLKDIKPGKHCYNVYVKVIEAAQSKLTTRNNDEINVVEGKVGDDSALANFRFIGDNADNLNVGDVVAFRNGKSVVVNEHIVLQLDRFGKVSHEKDVTIGDVNMSLNISDEKWEKKARNY